MERSLSLELVRVTEGAAVASGRWMGLGKKEEADGAATSAMRKVFDTIPMRGTVVIGEGEKDEAPMLYIGEKLGLGYLPAVDIAVDPLEGTNLVAQGMWNALSVVAISERGGLLHAPDMYMQKIAVGPKAVGKIDIDAPIETNLKALAKTLGKDMNDLVVVVLDRPRHKTVIEEVRKAGARIKLISDGDVAGAIYTCFDHTGVDVLIGIGGAPEGVLAAAALKCLGGELQGRLLPDDETQHQRCIQMGLSNPNQVLYMNDLVKGKDTIFAATGVTDGELLRGVRYLGTQAKTHSLVMRAKTGTLRFIEATHRLEKKPNLVL